MQRRRFVSGLAAGAAVPAGAQFHPHEAQGLRLSVTCDMFRGPDVRLPFDNPGRTDPRPQPVRKYAPEQALALTHASGYQGFEMFNWRDPAERAAYRAAQKKYGLECVCIFANKGVRAPGCSLVDPAEHEGFVEEIKKATAAAKEFGAKRLVVLSGMIREGVPRREQFDACVAGLRAAVPWLENSGMTFVLEPINSLVTRPGFFLDTASEGFAILERVDSPNVKLLFDIYHVQVQEGNLIPLIRDNIDLIGHFHIADHPGRHQPGTGEIHYRNVLRAIRDLEQAGKYSGFASIEYHPTVPLDQTMEEVRRLANFS